MQGEIRPGYKQTEVGVIPEDWEVDQLGNVLTLQRGFDLPKRLRRSGPIPIVTSSGTEDFHDQAAAKGPGIVTGRYGTIGKVYFVEGDYWPLNTTLWLRDFHGNDPLWAFLILQTVDFLSHSGKSGVPGVNRNDVHEELVCIPPLPQQRAIAGALSDADALIAALEAMIAKKRDLKQAAMQHLLTGKTRLPGFSGEWEVKRLGECASFFKGKGLPKSALSASGKFPCIHYGELFTFYGVTIADVTSRTDQSEGAFLSVQNDVLMPTSDVTPRGLAKASCLLADNVILGGDTLVIRPDELQLHGSFLAAQIRFRDEQVLQLVTGSTVFHLYASDMRKFMLPVPDPAEQTAIAEVLSDMDADLAALEAQAAKARAVKQGMMQELLTGKVRLV